MSKKLIAVVAFVLLGAGIVAAQTRPIGRGYHVVTLPSQPAWGEDVDTQILLETAHVRLTSIAMRPGAVLPVRSASTQMTIQAVSGRARLRLTAHNTVVALDQTRLVVLAPWMRHEIVANRRDGAVLLVHHTLPAPRRGRPF